MVIGKVVKDISCTDQGRKNFILLGKEIRTNGGKDRNKLVEVYLMKQQEADIELGQEIEIYGDIVLSTWENRLKGISYLVLSGRLIKIQNEHSILSFIGRLRHILQETSDRLLPRDSSAIMTSLLIGRTSFPVPSHIVEAFRNTGTIHILVVSGTQVSLLITLIWFLLKVVKIRAQGSSVSVLSIRKELRRRIGLKPRDEVIIVLRGISFFIIYSLIIIGYTYLVGSELPIRRAGIMGVLGILALILRREADIFNVFALTALLLLISYPPALFSISFQLSFLAVWGLIAVMPIVREVFPPPKNTFLKFFYLSFITSLSAQMAVTPLIIYHFKMLNPIGVIANIFTVPLSFLILIEGLCLLPLAIFIPFSGSIISFLLNLPITLLLKMVYFFSRLPLSSTKISLPSWIIFFYLFLLLFLGVVISTPSAKSVRKAFLILSSLFPLCLIWHNVF